ncbi:hypothetical protein [Actinoplanes xinjiangensis]|uniref:hypothetical protein n=1 Tax=Actinoplanes xinjiangensis TaxID=512350 RepID=UPI0034287B56
MSDVLVVTWDGSGAVAPALGAASELCDRGHRDVVGPVVPSAAPVRSTGGVLVSLAIRARPPPCNRWDRPVLVVVTTGNAVLPGGNRAASPVRVRGYVPHAEIMLPSRRRSATAPLCGCSPTTCRW